MERPRENTVIMVFVFIVLIMLVLASYGYFSGGWEHAPRPNEY